MNSELDNLVERFLSFREFLPPYTEKQKRKLKARIRDAYNEYDCLVDEQFDEIVRKFEAKEFPHYG